MKFELSRPWSLPAKEVLRALQSEEEKGLGGGEITARRLSAGANRLIRAGRRRIGIIFINQFRSVIVGLLAAAAAVSFAFGEWVEGWAILGVIMINSAIGFITELKADRSMDALRKLGTVRTRVRRQGAVAEIDSEELVPGDIVILEGGDIVTADLRLLTASKLQADESALTGESLAVNKDTGELKADTPLAERSNMLFKGTSVTRGSGEGIVVATGMRTELGRIADLVETAEDEVTPLEKRLAALGRKLISVTLVIAALVAISGVISGKNAYVMIETAIALAVATIPEGLPIVATIALARGMLRMARRRALINRLSAVETLGSTTIICTDKTGTLTRNRMTAVRFLCSTGDIKLDPGPGGAESPAGDILQEALEAGVLCSNASLARPDQPRASEAAGDPLEVALLRAAAGAGMNPENLRKRYPEEREVAFDSEVKMMATFNRRNGGCRVSVKGAAEEVLKFCSFIKTADGKDELSDKDRKFWLEQNRKLAEKGHRVLALAGKTVNDSGAPPYEDLVLLGLLGLSDPPRPEVRSALAACRDAGIRVVMITGDQAVTARLIGLAVGLVKSVRALVINGKDLKKPPDLSGEERRRILRAPIFARVNPEQKLDLISLYQEDGAVVAMTGDGVNDAPALKKADIGIAMGERGTQVAREAADMVLLDDAFSTIVSAIRQGRVIFDNIRSFVIYLLSCNISEVLVVGIAALLNAPLPILPLQILFLNLVTDIFPALALGVGEGSAAVMQRRPRPGEKPIISPANWAVIGRYGLLMTAAVLGAFWLAYRSPEFGEAKAVTVSFLTLSFTQLWHVFNMRGPGSGFFHNSITRNPFIWGALLLCTGLVMAAVYFPPLAAVLKLTDPGGRGWLIVAAMSLLPLFFEQTLGFVSSQVSKNGGRHV